MADREMNKLPLDLLEHVCGGRLSQMDRDAMDSFDLLDDIEKELGIATCPMNWPIGSGRNFRGVFDRRENRVVTFSDT